VSWFGSSFAINVAVGSMSLGVGRLGSSSFGRSSFFLDGSIYCYTSLVLAVSWMIEPLNLIGWLVKDEVDF
jgi:hypothetical protein